MSEQINLSLSTFSINDSGSQIEDWDRSLLSEPDASSASSVQPPPATPRNSVLFPVDGNATPIRTRVETTGSEGLRGKRTLSELLRLHAEKGTDVKFSAEEASRVADVLGQWINASMSPYEGEDDFFNRSHDDLSIPSKKVANPPATESRLRGQSESVHSRPPSSTGFIQ